MATLRNELAWISRTYLREARAMSYRELRSRQHAPWASIAFGAAGVAAAFVLSARGRPGSQRWGQARRWLVAAARGSRAREALVIPGSGSASVDDSLYFGADGIQFLRLVVAHATEPRARDPNRRSGGRALGAFLERCRSGRSGPSELLRGVAGYLTALVLLYRATRDPRIPGVADELAHDLLDRADGAAGWARSPSLGFAHGRAGISHALLGWSMLPGRELPEAYFRHLAALARDLKQHGMLGAPGGAAAVHLLERSWCSGASGHVLHWARAYERTSDAAYLREARDAARLLTSHTDAALGNLCCGLGGRAYALLAMDRIEPGRGWFERACAMGQLAAGMMVDHSGTWPNGLYKGYPGLVCLEHELRSERDQRVGFPLIEGDAPVIPDR